MNQSELLLLVDRLLLESKTALMTTVTADNRPASRWMTPRLMRNRPGFVYCVCRKDSKKLQHIASHPHVMFTVQDVHLREIVTLTGPAQFVDSPTLLSEFLENAGKDIFVIWNSNPKTTDLVMLETHIEQASLFRPMTGETLDIPFAP